MTTRVHRAVFLAGALFVLANSAQQSQQLSVTGPGSSAESSLRSFPADAEVRAMLKNFIPDLPGIVAVVGLLDSDGNARVIAHRQPGANDPVPDGDTVFEIGSVTKVFTGVLLGDMVLRGQLQLDEPLGRLLPREAHFPSRNGKQITLLDIVTHTSGLPRMPDDLSQHEDDAAITANYSLRQLYEFLSRYELPRDPGESYEYSNILGVLGEGLARTAGKPYETLLRERVLAPLGMMDTAVALTPEMKRRRVAGHDEYGEPAPYWLGPAFVPAGGLNSTANDLLRFVRASFSQDSTPPRAALRFALLPQRRMVENCYVGLAWGLLPMTRGYSALAIGGTFGFFAVVRLDIPTHRAVIVLGNCRGEIDSAANQLALHLLYPGFDRPKGYARYAVVAAYRNGGLSAAKNRYRTLQASDGDRWIVSSAELYSAGFWMLNHNGSDDALAMLQWNCDLYPNLPDPYDGLGNAYVRLGQFEKAVASYRKAVTAAEAEHGGNPNLHTYREHLERAIQRMQRRSPQ